MREVFRSLARRVRGPQPTRPVGRRATDAGMGDELAHGVLELGLRIGEAMLALGAPAADASAAIGRVVRTFGLVGCQVDLTFTSITLSYDRPSAVPMTVMRVVGERAHDFGRLSDVVALVDRVTTTPHDAADRPAVVERAHADLDGIVVAPRPYPRWVVTLLLAGLAAAVAVMLGGGPAVAVVAAGSTATIDRLAWALLRWGLPPFFVQASAAATATLVAVVLLVAVPRLPFDLAVLPPSLVVASGIIVLLAGMSLVGAAEDAISGFPLTASARTFEVVVLTLGLVVGVGGVLDVARRFGVPMEIIAVPRNTTPVVVQVLAAAAVAAAFAAASYARRRAVLMAGVAGGFAWTVMVLLQTAGLGAAVASAGAALVVGLLGELVGRRVGVPAIVTSVCGVVPLLPGLAIYRALFVLVNEQGGFLEGATGLLGAAMVGLGLAGGVTLGEFLAAPLRRARRIARRAVLRPRRPRAEQRGAEPRT